MSNFKQVSKGVKKGFVASKNEFTSLKDAEARLTGWFKSGDLERKTKVYQVVKTYNMVIKLKERK